MMFRFFHLIRSLSMAVFFALATLSQAAITFDPSPSSGGSGLTQIELIQDSGNTALSGQYLGVKFTSSTPLTNVYARAIVGGTSFTLDATEAQNHFVGDLSATAKTSYWFINFPPTGNGTFQVEIYVGNPAQSGAVLQGVSTAYTVSSANPDSSASANKIVSVAVLPSTLQLGQYFNVVVCYSVNSTARVALQPAIQSSFDPNNLRLGNVVVDAYGSSDCTGVSSGTFNNQLLYASVSSNSMRANYTFQTVGTVSVNLSPIVSARSGIYKYNSDFATPPGGVSYTVVAPVNKIKLTKSVNITESSTGTTVIYTVTAINSGSADVLLDDFVDTLPSSPANATYVAGSSKLNGVTVLSNPVISGQTLTWGNPDLSGTTASSFKVPAGGSVALSFQATLPSTNGLYTNSAIAHINGNIIGSTETLGSAPATASTAIGPPNLTVTKLALTPSVINSVNGTSATYTIAVSNSGTTAAGVLIGDQLPGGFTYLSNTPPVLGGGATRTAILNPTVGSSSPIWGTFTIPGSGVVTITFAVNVATAVANGKYDNSATVTSTTSGATLNNFNGALPANTADDVTVSTNVVLAVTKTAVTPNVINSSSGTSATYTVTVSNSSGSNATGVRLTDTLPSGFTYASTSLVTLNGATVLPANYAVTGVGTATPQWDTNPSAGFTLNAGQTLVVTFVANIASTVLDGSYNNSAGVTGSNANSITNFDGSLAANTSDNVTVTSAKLVVKKTTGSSVVNVSPDGTATYTITVSNNGTGTATSVKVIDTLPINFFYGNTASVTLNGAALVSTAYQVITSSPQTTSTPQWDTAVSGGFSINPGQTLVIVFNATLSGNGVNAVADGTYTNNASATGVAATITNYIGGNTDTLSNVGVTSATLVADKLTTTPVVINTPSGTSAIYKITIRNSGTGPANNVKVIDTLPANFSYGSTSSVTLNGVAVAAYQVITASPQTTGTPQWDTSPTGGFTIPAGQNLVITFVANIAAAVADGTYDNSAASTSTGVPAGKIFNYDGTNVSLNTENVTVVSAVLNVGKSTSTPAIVNTTSGTTASYTVTVTNNGTGTATGVSIADTLASGFTFASNTAPVLSGGATRSTTSDPLAGAIAPVWGVFTIPASGSVVITFIANVAASVANGTYDNSASVTGSDAKTVNNFLGSANTSDDVSVSGAVVVTGVAVSGFVYSDTNHNLQKDSAEAGTGLALFAKLIPATSAAGPAIQAVTVNTSTGLYQFASVPAAAYIIVIDDNNTLADVTPALLTAWQGTEMPDLKRLNVVVAATELQNLNFGLFNGNKVTGRVFIDNGVGSGSANNGVLDGAEAGLAGVSVKLTDSAGSTIYDSAKTDASGNYSLWLPAALTGTTLKVVEVNLSGYLSTGGSSGVPAGLPYDRAADAFSVNYTAGTNYTGVNFGDVPPNTLTGNNQQSTTPGGVVFYAHTFTAGTAGSVGFSTTSPAAWPQVLYRDSNCNGVLDSGETVISAAITVAANDKVCLILRVSIPFGSAINAQDIATLQASFSYTGANPALTANLVNTDITTVGVPTSSGLVLTKALNNLTPLPGATIVYIITYTNNSSAALGNIVINDATVAYTTFLAASCITPLPASLSACTVTTQPAVNGTGPLVWTLSGNLQPGANGQVTFSVKVDP